uniref:Uncharacterized protein n=1 Tax=Varanus komodoensis TaxID=61221 RepID=A0A8D2Q7B1_VARKO
MRVLALTRQPDQLLLIGQTAALAAPWGSHQVPLLKAWLLALRPADGSGPPCPFIRPGYPPPPPCPGAPQRLPWAHHLALLSQDALLSLGSIVDASSLREVIKDAIASVLPKVERVYVYLLDGDARLTCNDPPHELPQEGKLR